MAEIGQLGIYHAVFFEVAAKGLGKNDLKHFLLTVWISNRADVNTRA